MGVSSESVVEGKIETKPPARVAGHLKVVELLMKRHANVRAADRNRKTALDLTQDDTIREALQTGLQEQEKRQGLDKQAQKEGLNKQAQKVSFSLPPSPGRSCRHESCSPAAGHLTAC